jgi:hypothetical protein
MVENRSRLRRIAGLTALVVLVGVLAACGSDDKSDTATPGSSSAESIPAEPTAGSWKPWVLPSASAISVPAPPAAGSAQAEADLAEVKKLAGERTPEVTAAIEKWNGPLPTRPWTETTMEFVSKSAKNPPLSSRNYALVQVAMYDAVLAAYNAKYQYNVEPPEGVDTAVSPGADPSYPSEHAAIAGAAARILAHLYPNQSAQRLEEQAEEAAQSRVQAGVNTPSDVQAGLTLGKAVGDKVVEYAKADGAETLKWDGQRPPGIGGGPVYWEPPPGSVSPPVEPAAAQWKTWVLPDNAQLNPPPPPAFGSPEYLAAVQEMIDVKNNLTEEQKRIAKFWEGNEGTPLPAGITLGLAQEDVQEAATTGDAAKRLTVPEQARALALVGIVMADGGVSVWNGKYVYWYPRPENGVRDSGVDPNWTPHLPTPRFPAYPSGSAGYAGGAQAVLTYLFPEKAAEFKQRAEEQARSRLYAGIHWSFDAVSLDGGRELGAMVVERAKQDGSQQG